MKAPWATRALTGIALLGLSGCARDVGEIDACLPPHQAAEQVSALLYGRNLVTDPEVNAKMNEYVLAVSRDGVSADSVMPQFHRWLAAWARDHPERVAAARLRVGPRPR